MQLTASKGLVSRLLSILLLFALPISAASPDSGSVSSTVGSSTAWNGTAAGGASADESTCVEGVNCDTFTLTVGGVLTDWVGKQVAVKIEWIVPANDYDLYIHKGTVTGPEVGRSAGGAPQTSEQAAIDPSATGTGVYTVHVVYFTVAPDQYHGTATTANKPAARTATYVSGGITFSPNVTVKAPVASRDGEPSSRTDKFGNHYVSGIRGVPAGVDLWYFDLRPGSSPPYDPNMRNPIYRGQPDSFTNSQSTSVGADGGGDVDIAVGFSATDPATLASCSLTAANVSTQSSIDRGIHFTQNPAGSATGGVPVDDRQWIEFFGSDTVYLLYRTIAPAVTQIQRSIDGGITYEPATTAGLIGQVGGIDVDQSGTVYVSGSTGNVCVGVPPGTGLAPVTYKCNMAASDPNGVAHIFFVVKVASDGTAFVAYSNDKDIFLAHSTDKGNTWSLPVRVSNGPLTNVFPALETGPSSGSVGVAWYGTTEATNNNNADWKVYFAQSFNATAVSPSFRQVEAGDHFIHGSNISEGGTLGNANRNLLDYFQISFDPKGAAVIDYTDDHNDFDGHTYVTRQISGPSINGGTVPKPKAQDPTPASPDGQVIDFAQDVASGLLVVVPTNDPLDILSIKYSCESPTTGPVIVATMKVSDLSTIPTLSNWRMNFTANAPNSVLSPTGEYSFGLSDRGDQFFVRASTDAAGGKIFTYGTAVRNSDGSITYTTRGNADSGAFDSANKTITVKVSLSKLNPFVTHGPAIAVGSTLAGLRGQTFTSNVNAKRDIARGGTQFTIGSPSCSTGPPPPPPPPPPPNGPAVKVTGGGSIDGKVRSFTMNVDRTPSGFFKYRDSMENFELVSTSFLTFLETGPNEVTFSGTGTIGNDPVSFEVRVQDNGEKSTDDFFSIEITGKPPHSGNLSQGNIQIHR
jgi:hypothetical protein